MAEQIPDQQGRIVVVAVAPPGAGIGWQYAIPIRTRWKLRSVICELTTSAMVMNRIPELVITIGANELLRITAAELQIASVIFRHGWMEGERTLQIVGQLARMTSLPRGYLLNNEAVIAVETVALDAGDAWDDIVIVAEEWIEPLV